MGRMRNNAHPLVYLWFDLEGIFKWKFFASIIIGEKIVPIGLTSEKL
jgi:hypothetical protein